MRSHIAQAILVTGLALSNTSQASDPVSERVQAIIGSNGTELQCGEAWRIQAEITDTGITHTCPTTPRKCEIAEFMTNARGDIMYAIRPCGQGEVPQDADILTPAQSM